MVHGHNEGHNTPYTDIEFQQRKYHNFYEILKTKPDIRKSCNTFDNDKTCKTDGIKIIFHNRIKLRLQNKKAE